VLLTPQITKLIPVIQNKLRLAIPYSWYLNGGFMIDPLGPDPNDPATQPAKATEIISGFETPAAAPLLRPKVRHANYDSPEALIRPEDSRTQMPTLAPATSQATEPQAKLPPVVKAEPPAKPAAPPTVVSKSKQMPVPKSATSALARPVPPKPGKLERAVGFAKTMLPLVGNLLPLLEGNVAGVAANLIANRRGDEADLKPMQEAIAKLQSDQRALTFHTSEQKRAIRRIEDEFATLQEVVQKHAADQVELAEQLVKLAKRTSTFMRLVTILLVISILFSALLVVRIAYLMHS
jgi:hypothetical protein